MIQIIDLNFMGTDHTSASFLLDSSEGPVLVETGPHSTFDQLKNGLERHGYRPADVNHVFITHIHLDHAGAAWALAREGATIYLHPFGFKHMNDPSKLMASARRIYQDDMDRLWGDMQPIPAEQLRQVADEEEIRIGNLSLKAWHTPGHAVHHIAWQAGDSLFTGDVAGVRIEGNMVAPPCPPPDINIEDWQASLDRIRKLNISKLYLTHYGEVEKVEEHLYALEKRLLEWAEWMRPHFEKGTDPEAIRPLFEAYVREELIRHGISEHGLLQYEHANPAWMSVAGLLRYWRKKLEN